MNENDITIMNLDTVPKSRLYYYQGNFYYPLELSGKWIGIVKGAIRKFKKENAAMIEADRKHPEYKTIVQIFDEQFKEST